MPCDKETAMPCDKETAMPCDKDTAVPCDKDTAVPFPYSKIIDCDRDEDMIAIRTRQCRFPTPKSSIAIAIRTRQCRVLISGNVS